MTNARIIKIGTFVFDSAPIFYKWFNEPSIYLNNKTPAEKIKTEEGKEQVLELLTKIYYSEF